MRKDFVFFGRFLDGMGELLNVSLLAVRRCGRYAEREPRFFLGVLKKCQIGVRLWNSAGELLTRWGGEDTLEPGNFCIPHAICVDSRGDIYVGDLFHPHILWQIM